MAIYSALISKDNLTAEEIIKQCDGILSRCNGYRAVVEAVKPFAGNNSEEKRMLRPSAKRPSALATECLGDQVPWRPSA